MKLIKRLFYTICILMIMLCAGILYCALNPEITERLAQFVENTQNDNSGNDMTVPDNSSDVPETDISKPEIIGGLVESGRNDVIVPYKAPDDENVATPEEVGSRNGYEPIKNTEEQIGEKDAQSLKDTLNKGELGNDLSFDKDIYPYYEMLDERLKAIYRQIYANAMSTNNSFAPAEEINTTELRTVFEAFFNDHPEVFWVQTGYSCKRLQDNQVIEIVMKYYPIVNKLEAAKKEFESKAQGIIKGAAAYGSDYDKEKYVHDALMSNVDYNASADMSQSAYSALVNGSTVCAGYARAFQYIMQQLAIPTYYCTGYSGQEHAWNIVQLPDGYYNVDVTWDDTDPSTYNYFNKTDADYSKTHLRTGLSIYLPACNGNVYNAADGSKPEYVEVPENTEVVEKHIDPMIWEREHKATVSGGDVPWSEALRKAGVKQSDVITTLDAYYNNCYTQLVNAGSGDKQFVNVVTKVEWIVIEQEYLTGRYEDGYVKSALKKLGMDRFAIQIQAEDLGDGYYRLYHNVVTWKD